MVTLGKSASLSGGCLSGGARDEALASSRRQMETPRTAPNNRAKTLAAPAVKGLASTSAANRARQVFWPFVSGVRALKSASISRKAPLACCAASFAKRSIRETRNSAGGASASCVSSAKPLARNCARCAIWAPVGAAIQRRPIAPLSPVHRGPGARPLKTLCGKFAPGPVAMGAASKGMSSQSDRRS